MFSHFSSQLFGLITKRRLSCIEHHRQSRGTKRATIMTDPVFLWLFMVNAEECVLLKGSLSQDQVRKRKKGQDWCRCLIILNQPEEAVVFLCYLRADIIQISAENRKTTPCTPKHHRMCQQLTSDASARGCTMHQKAICDPDWTPYFLSKT